MRFELDERRIRLAGFALVMLVAVGVFLNSLGNQFTYDDVWIIQDRGVVHHLGHLWKIISTEYWPEIYQSGLYRPLTLLSFAVDWFVWNGSPLGFHLVNVLLHAIVSGLVFLLLLRFFPWWAALIGGFVFAVHPVHTEAVANIVGRAEVLAALWVLCATLVYVRVTRAGGLNAKAVALIALFYALAGLSKEGGVVLPGLLLVTDLPRFARHEISSVRDYFRSRFPLFAVLAVILALILLARWAVLGVAVANVPDPIFALDSRFHTRFFTMIRVWPRYLELMIVPLQLSSDYGPAIILPATSITPLGVAGFLAVFLMVASSVVLFRRAPEFAMALAWFSVAIAPVSNLIITAEIILAERTLYLPSVAFSIIVALLLAKARPVLRRWLVAAMVLWVVGFSVVTVRRNPVWYDMSTLFEDLRHHHPESVRLLMGVGAQLQKEHWEEARSVYRRAMRLWPHHAPYNVEYAFYLYKHGEYQEADRLVAAAVRTDPKQRDWARFLIVIRNSAENWAGALAAIDSYRRNLGADGFLYITEAQALEGLGRYPEAVEAQQAAVRIYGEKSNWITRLDLARLHAEAGDTAAALSDLVWALQAPDAEPAIGDSLRRAWGGIR